MSASRPIRFLLFSGLQSGNRSPTFSTLVFFSPPPSSILYVVLPHIYSSAKQLLAGNWLAHCSSSSYVGWPSQESVRSLFGGPHGPVPVPDRFLWQLTFCQYELTVKRRCSEEVKEEGTGFAGELLEACLLLYRKMFEQSGQKDAYQKHNQHELLRNLLLDQGHFPTNRRSKNRPYQGLSRDHRGFFRPPNSL